MRLPVLSGVSQPRSIIANAQRCVNYFPEMNTKDALVPVTHYQRPGLRPLVTGPNAPVRGVFRASNGVGYCVIGQNVYQISTTWQLTQLGTLAIAGTNPVSYSDNGIVTLLVDGTNIGYTWNLTTGGFTQVSDPTGIFQGADRVDYIDTFLLWNLPGTNQFGSTYSNELVFDALYTAGKTNFPDLLQTVIVNRHLVLLIGTLKTEVWYDAGLANFPFAELPGAYYEHGTGAKYSVAAQDISVYFLGQDLQGQGIVFRITGYECKRISNHTIEYQLRQMVAAGAVLSDAIGYCHQFDGHIFYVLHFPSGNQSWQFDEASQEWSQLAWTDSNGRLNRHRANCAAFINGVNVCGDWENGTIYQMDPNTYTDTVNGISGPISFIRGFPHIGEGTVNLGGMGLDRGVSSDGKRMQFDNFILDLECGTGPLDASGNPATVMLRWSRDKGRTFGNAILQSAGSPGDYLTEPQWRQQGIARDMVFEIEHSIAGPAALNGAWVTAKVLAT